MDLKIFCNLIIRILIATKLPAGCRCTVVFTIAIPIKKDKREVERRQTSFRGTDV